jgi:hypothetical protein
LFTQFLLHLAGVYLLSPRRGEKRRCTLIWILVLLIAILAIAGGLAISKFLFILLVIAVIVALLGARSAV